MTDGSSQGLFVIVAVVIFGIFVLISYILFRDNLKTGLSDIFEDSISDSLDNLHKNLISESSVNVSVANKATTLKGVKHSSKIRLEADGTKTQFDGIQITGKRFKKDTWYKLTYKITVLEGSIEHIGGHIAFIAEDPTQLSRNFSINSDKYTESYTLNRRKLPKSTEYLVSVEVLSLGNEFKYGISSSGVWIQPNRYLAQGNYKLDVSNIRIVEV